MKKIGDYITLIGVYRLCPVEGRLRADIDGSRRNIGRDRSGEAVGWGTR